MKKRGISLTALTIGVVILLILLSTISISITYSINNAKKRTFAEEIYNLQSVVNEYIEKEETLPLTTATLQIQISDGTQFEGETINAGKITLEELDLVELGIKNTVYGTKEDDARDVYAISAETRRVYYVAGFKSGNKTYYTLIDELLKMVERNQNLAISENSITFTPSTVGWSSEGISLVVTVPSEYQNPNLQIDNANIVFNTTTQNGVTVYTVNQAKLAEKYTVTINYTKDGKAGTATYSAKIDKTAPVISKDANVSNTTTHVKGINATDNESGIKYFKYVEGAINNDSNIKAYMHEYGKNLTKGTVKFKNPTPYTLYAEDKAGNYSTLYIDNEGVLTAEKPVENNLPKIPKGFVASIYDGEKTIEEGLVIYETSSLAGIDQETAMTSYNQFVWVPVDDFGKFERTETYNGTIREPRSSYTEPYSYDTTITEANDLTGEWAEYTAMRASVKENKGFYIGRYETGTTAARTDVANRTTDVVVQKGKPIYNYVAWGPSMTSVSGDVTYNTQNQGKGAVELSRNMYKGSSSVVSTLCYGVQWDSALQFIYNTDNTYPTNSENKGNYVGSIANTGSNDNYAVNNIYDMAGNVWEWTMEAYFSHCRIARGGISDVDASNDAAYYRISFIPTDASFDGGFRVSLYIK